MNAIQRRVLRAFVDSGGDLAEASQVDDLVRFVETRMCLLPPKLRTAIEIGWELPKGVDYEEIARRLSHSEGVVVKPVTARQRVSRALRALEPPIRAQAWSLRTVRTLPG